MSDYTRMAEIMAAMIDAKGSRRSFAEKIGVPPTTLQSMLTKDMSRASVILVMKACKELGITVEQLEQMANEERNYEPTTIAAHHDGEDWTEDELEDIEEFKELLKLKRQLKK